MTGNTLDEGTVKRVKWLILGAVLVSVVLASMVFYRAAAQEGEEFRFDFSAPTDSKGRARLDAPPGSVHTLGVVQVPPALSGSSCMGVVRGSNNQSVHPGNDLTLTSANSVTALDVERAPGAETGFSPELELGESVTVTLTMGEDGTFSGSAWEVVMSCVPPPTTTTTVPPTTTPETTTSVPTTSTSTSTTTTAVPTSTVPSTSLVPTTVGPTTVPPGPTTTALGGPTTTVVQGPPRDECPEEPGTTASTTGSGTECELARTGSQGDVALGALAVLMIGGGVLLREVSLRRLRG